MRELSLIKLIHFN